MLSFGTTTCEAKSGYGLTTDEELKQLRAIQKLQEGHAVDVVATFMGAHALPSEYKGNRDAYIRLLCEEMIPAVAEQKIAKFCDVFCETGSWSAGCHGIRFQSWLLPMLEYAVCYWTGMPEVQAYAGRSANSCHA